MSGADAIRHAADIYGVPSMYAMAKALSDEDLTVQTIQIKNYLTGTRMSKKVADRFEAVYDIHITDAYESNAMRQNYDV